MIGSIIFFIVETRPDIAFANSVISRFTKNSFHQHSKAMKTILQYLKTIRETRIMYDEEQRGDLIIKRYSDSNWASDHATRILTSRYIFIFNRRPIRLSSKHQSTVAFSLTKAKYVALILAAKKTTWLWLLLIKLGLLLPTNYYAEIKVTEKSRGAKEIKANFKDKEKEDN